MAHSKALLVLFIFINTSLVAQEGLISGIINSSNNQPLPGVNVYLRDTKSGTTTNGSGKFTLKDVPVGDYKLIVSSVGYESTSQEISVNGNEQLTLSVNLKELVVTLPGVVIERVTMTGGNTGIVDLPGSAHYISPKEMKKFNYNDINRMLRTIPGVNIQEEDGFGLRPNIGMRGTGVERSSKITVMEDGILMAPAPYAAPAAYYFPTVGRMNAIEVAKGSTQIKYGPFTTGGAINFISTQIPAELTGRINLFAGSFGMRTVGASVGNSYDNFGFVFETFQSAADGFKELDNGGNTGFDKKDYLAKVRINTNETAAVCQSLTFKVGQTDETSDETYLGLTTQDFDTNPLRRYAGSQVDQMNTGQTQFSLTHVIRPVSFMDITTIAYRNDFKRNWYKLDKVRSLQDGPSTGISSVLDDPQTYLAEFDIIRGSTSLNDNALLVKANNREYYSQGIQTLVGFQFNGDAIAHDIEVGVRVHKDQVDRFQWVDNYRMDNGVTELTQSGIPGTESNRVTNANAVATHIQYKLTVGKLTAIPGLRYENIKIERLNYGSDDPDRTGTELSIRNNHIGVLIPGMGIDYKFSEQLSAFSGIHRGFSPPSSREDTKAEKSINYELGTRFSKSGWAGQAVLFFNDYRNLLGSDLAAVGGAGSNDLFNGGEVNARGLELQLNYDVLSRYNTKWSLPLMLTYTYTDAEFRSSFESEFEGWGSVSEGDNLPYLAKNQLSFSAGLESDKLSINLSAKYMDEMRTVAGQGDILAGFKTDRYLVLDLSSEYFVSHEVSLFGSIKNITNQSYIVARRPAGLRPGLPRSFTIGMKAQF